MPDRFTTLKLLRNSAHDLAREIEMIPPEVALWHPAEGEWSVHEALTHLRDGERIVFLPRIQRVIREERPALPLVDEATYHKEHWNPDEPLAQILAGFIAARAEEVDLLQSAPDWSRMGVHESRGPISLEWLADYALGHTWEHLSQIMRVRLSYETRKK